MSLIFTRVANFCWCCFKWGLALGVVAVAVGLFYLNDRLDEEIRRGVQQRIAQHYVGLEVTVRSAALVEGKGIEVRGLSILQRGAEGPRAELVYLDELFLQCRTDLQELIAGEPQVTHITVRRPTLRVTRRPDGTWSAEKLLPLPRFSEHPPAITIENGTIELFDPLKSPASTLPFRDVNLTFAAPDPSAGNPHARTLQGTFGADHLRKVEVDGVVDLQAQRWTVGGSIEGLDVSPETRDALPGPLAAKLAVLGELRGQAALTFRVGHDPSLPSPYRFELKGQLVRGRIDAAALPHSLTDMSVRFRLNNEGLDVDELRARSGQAWLWMSAHQKGFELGTSPLELEAEIWQLELDRAVRDRLPERLKKEWQKYDPSGRVENVKVSLFFDGQTWHPPVVLAQCSDVSFSHEKFRYPLEHAVGSVEWKKDDSLEMHLTAYSGSRPVYVDAEVQHVSSQPTYWLTAKGDGLPLDQKLLGALQDKPHAVVSSLHPSGTVNFRLGLHRDRPRGPTHKDLVIDLNRCSMRYDKFPYPLSDVRGRLEMHDDQWTFHRLDATNDTGYVTCTGHMTPPGPGQELYLKFTATDVPLDEELRNAMPLDKQRVWNGLRPHGKVDLDEVVVRYAPAQGDRPKHFSLRVRARPKGDATRIEPVSFPYLMEKLSGVLVYQDGHVTLEDFAAVHGSVKLSTGGYCDFLPDGRWALQLDGLDVDPLHLDDRELIEALPGRLRKVIEQIQPLGQVHLAGSFDLEGSAMAGGPVRCGWDLDIGLFQGTVDCGVKLENVYGSMTLKGGFDGRRFDSLGELNIDSLTYKDHQFTQVKGPVWLDDRKVLLGSWVGHTDNETGPRRPAPSTQPARPLTATLFGGTVFCDAWVTLGPELRYGLHASLPQADLSRFAQETLAGQQNLRGKIMASIDLGGSGRTLNGLGGSGTIRLRDADIYELPLMIALLSILTISEVDRTAFSESDIVFDIRGPHLYFEQINFSGDAISLRGRGEMDLQSKEPNVDLAFHAIVGRGNWNLPIIKEVFSGASQQIMQIKVTGTLQNPETREVLFPAFNQTLQQFQHNLNKATNPQGLFPQAQQWMPNVGRGWGRRD